MRISIALAVLIASTAGAKGAGPFVGGEKLGEGFAALGRRVEAQRQARETSAEPAYVAECRAAAVRKLERQAQSYGITVDMGTLRISGRDERAENPSKYFWWSVDVTDIGGRTDIYGPGKDRILTKLTQKYLDKPCF